MSAETDLRALLVGASAITALVGQRIAADRIEQGAARPFIVFTRTGTERSRCLDGTISAVKATFELQVWADTRLAADAVADAIETVIETDQQFVLGRSTGYDGELDLEASILTIDWWQ
jgi:hypothetical protein